MRFKTQNCNQHLKERRLLESFWKFFSRSDNSYNRNDSNIKSTSSSNSSNIVIMVMTVRTARIVITVVIVVIVVIVGYIVVPYPINLVVSIFFSIIPI